jgi:hypothetical protein
LYGYSWKKEIERMAVETFNLDPSEDVPAGAVQYVLIYLYNQIMSQAMAAGAEVRVEKPIEESPREIKERRLT